MAVNLSFIGGAGWQFLDNSGNPLSGGKVYTYAAGTTTPQVTFTSRTGLTSNANPIILDSAGRTPEQIWSTEGLLYKYVVETATGVLIRSWDNIGGSVVASDLAQDLASTTDNTKGDALVGFRQSNSAGFLTGSVGRTLSNKMQESVSVKDFGAVGDGVADDTAAIQLAVNSAASSIYFPDGTYRVVGQVLIGNDKTLFSQGATIFVDPSGDYLGAFTCDGDNIEIEGIRFEGNGVATNTSVPSPAQNGSTGWAIRGYQVRNIKVKGCSFYDMLGFGDCIAFASSSEFLITQNYFDSSVESSGDDIRLAYRAGKSIVTDNLSFSGNDIFAYIASVGSGDVDPAGTELSVTSHHIIANNIHIKNNGAVVPTGRHGILVHYAGGISHSVITGNIMVNGTRHGLYIRGTNGFTGDAGPDVISNNIVRYFGGLDSDGGDWRTNSGILLETTRPTILEGNLVEKAGYNTDGTARTYTAGGIGCRRGLRNAIISNNQINDINGVGITISPLVSLDVGLIVNVEIHGNMVRNVTQGGIVVVNQRTSPNNITSSVSIYHNTIEVSGSDFCAIAVTTNRNSAGGIDTTIKNNVIKGIGAGTNKTGICFEFNADLGYQITGNVLRNLDVGVRSGNANSYGFFTNISFVSHRAIGTKILISKNAFFDCVLSLVCSTVGIGVLSFISPDNTFLGTSQKPFANINGSGRWVLGEICGYDSSGNALVKLYVDAVPTDAQQYFVGDQTRTLTPTAGGNIGSVCTTSGTPGTFKTFGAIAA
jgi:hypothetical protein